MSATTRRSSMPYTDPYLAGFGLGLVLLAAFVVMGRGLGASGAFSSTVTAAVRTVDAERTTTNPAYERYLNPAGGSPLKDWLVVEIVGVLLGGALSAGAAGRIRFGVERGPRITPRARLVAAFGGGLLMGVGAKFARGCTSGLAITGGALLGVGAWLFIVGAFAAGYLAAPFLKGLWR